MTGGTGYIVVEMGPELFVPSGNGQIVSNQNLQGMGGINISGGLNITLPNVTNGQQFKREIESWFNEFVRKNRNTGAYMAGV